VQAEEMRMMTRITSQKQAIKDKAQASLLECLGAVQNAIAALPDNVAKAPKTLAEAFIQIDPVLSMLHRQLLDARAHIAELTLAFGPGDPMLEALMTQICAIERAYEERLAALRKKREESAAKQTSFEKEFRTEEKLLPEVRRQNNPEHQRNNGALWLWTFLILHASATSAKRYGLRAA
jgi:hypothetical protein